MLRSKTILTHDAADFAPCAAKTYMASNAFTERKWTPHMKNVSKVLLGGLAGISAAYLYAIAPSRRKSRRMELLKQYDYAHRGLHDNAWGIPENSMAAFEKAVSKNYGIELDIHLTKDRRLVVFHDNNLWRMCHIKRDICEMTWEKLKDVRLIGTRETIPLFEDVLQLVSGRVPLIIELKVDKGNYNELCAAADQMLSRYKGPYCIESFHPLAIVWYRKNRKNVIRGQLSCNFSRTPSSWQAGPLILSHLVTNAAARPDFIAYNFQDIKNLGFFLNHKLFKAMTVLWTVSNEQDRKILKKLGHTIIFEHFEP